MSVLIEIVQGLVKKYGSVTPSERRPLTPSMRCLFDEFWLQLGVHLKLIQGGAKSYHLVYHNIEVVLASHLRTKLVSLTMLFLVYR